MEKKHLAVEPSSRESSFDPPSYSISHGKDYTLQWHPAVGSKELAVALSYHFPLETTMERKMRAATKKFLKEEKRKVEISSGHSGLDTAGLASVAKESAEGTTSGQLPSKESWPELSIEPNNTDLWVNDQAPSSSPDTVSKPKPAHLQENTKSEVAEPTVPHPSPEQAFPKILSWVRGVDNKEPKRRKRRYGMLEAAEAAANRGNVCDDHRKRKVKVMQARVLSQQWASASDKPCQCTAKPSLLSQVLRRLTPDANPKASDTSAHETTRPRATSLSKPPQQSQSNAVQLSSTSASDGIHSEKVNSVPESTKSKPRTIHNGQSQSNVTNDNGTSTTTFGSAHEASIQHPVFLPTAHTSGLHSAIVDTSWPPLPNDFMTYHIDDIETSHDLNENSPWFLEEANVLGDWDVGLSMPEGLQSFTDPADQGRSLSLEDIESVLNAPVSRHQFSTISDLIQSPILGDYPLLSEEQLPLADYRPSLGREQFPGLIPQKHSPASRAASFSGRRKERPAQMNAFTQLGRHSNDWLFNGDSAVSTRNLFTPPIEEYKLPDTGGPVALENGHTEAKSKNSVSTRLKNMTSSPRKRRTVIYCARHTMSLNPGIADSPPPFMEKCHQPISPSMNLDLNSSQVQSWCEVVLSWCRQTSEQYLPQYEIEIVSDLEGFSLG
ncbi:hypothetical protein DL95DRAFT_470147 [Leptodontidium sp. 2 PMI_412]|nr:hypothetical protein DL95DRAFT_470147 [Leptodontidium sp. 2 PMI_412]